MGSWQSQNFTLHSQERMRSKEPHQRPCWGGECACSWGACYVMIRQKPVSFCKQIPNIRNRMSFLLGSSVSYEKCPQIFFSHFLQPAGETGERHVPQAQRKAGAKPCRKGRSMKSCTESSGLPRPLPLNGFQKVGSQVNAPPGKRL